MGNQKRRECDHKLQSSITFLFVLDVCSNEAPEEFYDSPSLGSPRAVPVPPKPPSSPQHLQDDIGVGSLVEVATDVDQNYYGVVRWIGLIDGEYH